MPLTFDMSWDKLQTYSGTNPRPEDFDTYWDDALAARSTVEPNPTITPSEFQTPYAICSDYTYTGIGGARIHAKLLQPRVIQSTHPAIIQFHGYGGNAGDWFDKLPWVALGFTVVALDCRGQGGDSEDFGGVPGNTKEGHIIRGIEGRKEDLLYRSIYLDTVQLAHLVMAMPDVDPSRIGVFGSSQGGGLALACAALVPQVNKVAAIHPFLSDFMRVWTIDQDVEAYEEIRTYFRLRDPQHLHEQEFFTRLGYVDVQHLANRIKGEVLMAVGLRDKICPPSTQFAAYNKITAPKHLAVYPDFAHETMRGFADQLFQFFADL